jgi:hypothetical protein
MFPFMPLKPFKRSFRNAVSQQFFSRAVDLIMAIRVEENPIFCPVAAAVGPPNYMVVVPAS